MLVVDPLLCEQRFQGVEDFAEEVAQSVASEGRIRDGLPKGEQPAKILL